MSKAPPSRNPLKLIQRTERRSKGIGTVRAREWRSFTLENGWQQLDGFAPPGFHRSDGYVYLRGVLTGGTSGSEFAQLPEGYRPEYPTRLATLSSGGAPARVDCDTDGTLTATGAGTWVTLDGLVFRAHA